MACALALFALLVPAVRGGAPWAVEAAHHLDTRLLAPLATTSAATGLVLSLGTAWGLALHRWVLSKLALTLVQLYLGIFVLSGALSTAADTLRVSPALVVGTALMAGAIAVQAWLSVAKPGGRTRWGTRGGRPVTLPAAPAWVFALVVVAPVVDVTLGLLLGIPSPLCPLAAVVVAAVVRHRSLRRPAPACSSRLAVRKLPTRGRTRLPGGAAALREVMIAVAVRRGRAAEPWLDEDVDHGRQAGWTHDRCRRAPRACS